MSRMINLQHFIFTPKYRRSMLERIAVAHRCEAHIRHIAWLKGYTIHSISVQPDHVHVFVELPRTQGDIPKVAFLLKWYSSRWLRIEFPELKAECPKALWGHRYFYRSVGGDARTVKQYIDNQIRRTANE